MTKPLNQDSDTYLTNLFAKHSRIYLGDELKQKLVDNLGKSAAAARKIIERFAAKGLVETSKPVSFGKNKTAHKKSYHRLNNLVAVSRKIVNSGANL